MILRLKKGGSQNGTFDQGRVLWRGGGRFIFKCSSFQVFKFSSFYVSKDFEENQHLDSNKV